VIKHTTNTKLEKAKTEDAANTRKRIEMMFHKSLDPNVFEGVLLDKREAARFICEKTRILRLVADAARLPSVSWLIENTFYEAYMKAQLNAQVDV
jgi:hypothetical protein